MSKISPRILASSAAAVAVLASALSNPANAGAVPLTSKQMPSVAVPSAGGPVKRVLAISVDGLNPRALTRFAPSNTPAFHRMMTEGAYTLNARTLWGQTRTLPDHTSMLTSRRLDPEHGGTGVRFNRDNGSTVHKAAGHYIPSVFDVVHDRGGSTALYSAKPKFQFFARSWATHGRLDTVGADNGRSKIDAVRISGNNVRLVADLNTALRTSPRTFTFLHISLPDSAGHRHGFMGPEYLKAVQQTDRLLGSLLTTIAGDSALRNDTLVILTADHGGDGIGHEDPTLLQNYQVPFMVWGAGVSPGRNLYSINPTLKAPGSTRPGYAGKQPIRNGDLGNLATEALGLPAIPGSEFNGAQTLVVS